MLVKSATTRECEALFRRDLERRGHRFGHYKKKWQRSEAALSVVQAANLNAPTASAVQVNINTTAGNLLVFACAEGANTTSTLAVSDSTAGSNTWVQAGNYISLGGRMALFYAANAAAVTSVTGTWSGGLSVSVDGIVFEIANAVQVSPLDPNVLNSIASTQAASVTALPSGSLSSSNMLDILLYVVKVGGSTAGGFTVGSGYTFPANNATAAMSMQYKIVSAVQNATTTTMTWVTTRGNDLGFFAAFMGLPNLVDKDIVPGAGGQAINSSYAVPY